MKKNFKNIFLSLINIKKYIYTILLYLAIIISLTLFFKYVFIIQPDYKSTFKESSLQNSIQIILNNTRNFIQYILFAPFMPIFFFLDCIITSWSITVSITNYGLLATFCKLFPHGFIEIPNFCLYVNISYLLMKDFYINFKNKDYNFFKSILKYKSILILNFLLVIIAGFVEGLIT